MEADRLFVADKIKEIISKIPGYADASFVYDAMSLIKNSMPITCSNCGNKNLVDGSDENDNQHEWHCECGWSLLRQGNEWSQMFFGPPKQVPLGDVLFECIRKAWEGPDPISETAARTLIVYLLAAFKAVENNTFMHVNIFAMGSKEIDEILYKNIPKDRWPKNE